MWLQQCFKRNTLKDSFEVINLNTSEILIAYLSNIFRSLIFFRFYILYFNEQWCPPCLKLLPEWRKAGKQIGGTVAKFGTVDCTIHMNLCQQVIFVITFLKNLQKTEVTGQASQDFKVDIQWKTKYAFLYPFCVIKTFYGVSRVA